MSVKRRALVMLFGRLQAMGLRILPESGMKPQHRDIPSLFQCDWSLAGVAALLARGATGVQAVSMLVRCPPPDYEPLHLACSALQVGTRQTPRALRLGTSCGVSWECSTSALPPSAAATRCVHRLFGTPPPSPHLAFEVVLLIDVASRYACTCRT